MTPMRQPRFSPLSAFHSDAIRRRPPCHARRVYVAAADASAAYRRQPLPPDFAMRCAARCRARRRAMRQRVTCGGTQRAAQQAYRRKA
jgi:hypothetical protein